MQADRAKHRYALRAVGCDVIALLVIFAAWWAAWRQTHDLEWPCENDLFRDLGAAQSIVDGQPGVDPAYLGERWWYNPLVPAVVGLAGRALGMPLHEAYAKLGTHLNLIAPLGLYAMMAVLLSRRAALAALIGFLFLGPHGHVSWLHATYSPWLWTCNFSQGLLYVSVLLLAWTLRSREPRWAIAAGLSMGLTLLAHTAPSVVVGVILLTVTMGELIFARREPEAARRALAVAAMAGSVAAIVAWPFWVDVLDHVRRGIRNPVPMQWLAAELTVGYLPRLVMWHESLRGVFALYGLVQLLFQSRRYGRHFRRALLGWSLATLLGLAYGYASQLTTLPTFLPSWHFYFYLQALESVLFGVGVAALADAFVRMAIRTEETSRWSRPKLDVAAYVACLGPILVYAGLRYDRYRSRMDLVDNRRAALESAHARTVDLYRWIVGNTEPDDVFLAEPEASFYAVATAGRKVVAMQDLFSNPYLDVAQRAREADVMLSRLKEANWSEFLRIAGRYRVKYVALPVAERERIAENGAKALRRVFTAEDTRGWDVYEARF